MKILVNSGAEIRHQLKKEISPLSARTILKENIRQEDAKIAANYNRGQLIDKADAIRNKKAWEKDLNRTCPEKLSPEAQSVLWKRAKQLKDEFSVGMLSNEELHPVKSHLVNGKINVVADEGIIQGRDCVRRQQAWDKANGEKVREYKNILRHLDPDNPFASDIEKFRPKKAILR